MKLAHSWVKPMVHMGIYAAAHGCRANTRGAELRAQLEARELRQVQLLYGRRPLSLAGAAEDHQAAHVDHGHAAAPAELHGRPLREDHPTGVQHLGCLEGFIAVGTTDHHHARPVNHYCDTTGSSVQHLRTDLKLHACQVKQLGRFEPAGVALAADDDAAPLVQHDRRAVAPAVAHVRARREGHRHEVQDLGCGQGALLPRAPAGHEEPPPVEQGRGAVRPRRRHGRTSPERQRDQIEEAGGGEAPHAIVAPDEEYSHGIEEDRRARVHGTAHSWSSLKPCPSHAKHLGGVQSAGTIITSKDDDSRMRGPRSGWVHQARLMPGDGLTPTSLRCLSAGCPGALHVDEAFCTSHGGFSRRHRL
mmetsp:Transcript_43359/g.125131  ORF Transcript_43359/g.125131 Transcript_43359/m.125131 type:complete len:361 (+) Transcript_43359:41-1123(+)